MYGGWLVLHDMAVAGMPSHIRTHSPRLFICVAIPFVFLIDMGVDGLLGHALLLCNTLMWELSTSRWGHHHHRHWPNWKMAIIKRQFNGITARDIVNGVRRCMNAAAAAVSDIRVHWSNWFYFAISIQYRSTFSCSSTVRFISQDVRFPTWNYRWTCTKAEGNVFQFHFKHFNANKMNGNCSFVHCGDRKFHTRGEWGLLLPCQLPFRTQRINWLNTLVFGDAPFDCFATQSEQVESSGGTLLCSRHALMRTNTNNNNNNSK